MAPDAEEVRALRRVVVRNIRDAAIPELSSDARLGLSYDAARSAACMGIRASGYRVKALRSHETTFEGLSIMGRPFESYEAYFQQLRIKRHALTYATAGETSDAEADEALSLARALFTDMEAWIRATFPELLG